MKTAQELKPGNVVVIDSTPIVIQKAELNKSGRNAAVMKFKFRNLLTGGNSKLFIKRTRNSKILFLKPNKSLILMRLEICMSLWMKNTINMNCLKTILKGFEVS